MRVFASDGYGTGRMRSHAFAQLMARWTVSYIGLGLARLGYGPSGPICKRKRVDVRVRASNAIWDMHPGALDPDWALLLLVRRALTGRRPAGGGQYAMSLRRPWPRPGLSIQTDADPLCGVARLQRLESARVRAEC